jgi:hypothetical protein
MRYYQKIQWLVVVFILLVGLFGCDSGDGGLTAPAVSTGSASPANFWVGRGGDKLGIYSEDEALQVQVPAGAYVLEYTTTLGAFYIVFSSEDGAFLAIGLLPDDRLVDVNLYEVTLNPDAVPDPDYSKDGVLVFYWPGSSVELTLEGVCTLKPETLIVIMKDGVLVLTGDVVIVELPKVEPTKFYTIETWVNDETLGVIDPEGPMERPAGSSKSFKIRRKDGNPFRYQAADPQDTVYLNGVDVTDQVQILGSGEGHLVIHGIDMDILIEVYFAP